MKLAIATAVSILCLAAPAWAGELKERNHQPVRTKTIHDLSVSTTTTTVFATVTVGLQGTQEQVAAAAPTEATFSQDDVTTTTRRRNRRPHKVTKTKTRTIAVTRDEVVTKTVTETHVVTKTDFVGATVTSTELVEHTVLTTAAEDFTTTVEEEFTTTVTADVTEFTTIVYTTPVTVTITEDDTTFITTQDATLTTTELVEETGTQEDSATETGVEIKTVNTDVETDTVVETSTAVETTVVDGTTEVGNIADNTSTSDNAEPTGADQNGDQNGNGNQNGDQNGNQNDDPQTSLTVDPRVIQPGLALTGQETPTPGQVESLTSTNNFINFCLTQNVPLTDGQQIRSGSCNVVPMGMIIAKDKIPSAKFVFPKNFGSVPANQAFTVKLKLKNLQAGAFTNAQKTYYGAPATVNGQGVAIGHSHVVIEKLPSLDTTEPLDPTTFAFFKGLNAPLDGDSILSTTLDKGLEAGFYRMFSINTASNHQPVLCSVAQHGSVDDGVYFTVQ